MYKIKSGHSMCHPETCSCWDYHVYNTETGEVVLQTDDFDEAKEYQDNLNTGKSLQWV